MIPKTQWVSGETSPEIVRSRQRFQLTGAHLKFGATVYVLMSGEIKKKKKSLSGKSSLGSTKILVF